MEIRWLISFSIAGFIPNTVVLLYTIVENFFYAGYLCQYSSAEVLGLRQIDPRIPIQEGKEADDNRRESIHAISACKGTNAPNWCFQQRAEAAHWLMWLRMSK